MKRAARTPNSSAKATTPSSAVPPARKLRRPDEVQPMALFRGESADTMNDSQLPFGYRDTFVESPEPPQPVLEDPYTARRKFPVPALMSIGNFNV